MLFSIIIPSFNNDELLTRCLNTLVNLNLENNEIVVIDDGSNKNQLEFIPDFLVNHKNFKFIRQKNSGLSEARNAGIKISKGKFLIFIDGDDYIKMDDFNQFYQRINNSPNITNFDLIRVGFYQWNKNKIRKKYCRKEKYFLDAPSRYIFFVLLLGKILAFSSWTHIYNRNFLINNNLFFKKGILAEDLDHLIRSYDLINNVYIYNGAYYVYDNTNSESIMNTKTEKLSQDIISFINIDNVHNNQLKSFLIIWYLLKFLPTYKHRIKNIDKKIYKVFFWIFNFNNNKNN